ncbi:hypothetical protein [Burkholderia sp. TSV86]|uniref:hypothetical protein n=1 Tax=Burkholderia sp. TSV86 TaxID=1385594 RepID=UPI0009E8B3AE|nr:hypothetical protein [Burkholderia sp. TSV86]
MYKLLESHSSEIENISKILNQDDNSQRIGEICRALEETAQRIGETKSTTELDRSNLIKLYRGFFAASRVLQQLQHRER